MGLESKAESSEQANKNTLVSGEGSRGMIIAIGQE
jgi:hypothetical protein